MMQNQKNLDLELLLLKLRENKVLTDPEEIEIMRHILNGRDLKDLLDQYYQK